MQRSIIPKRTSFFIIGTWILQLISLFLPYRVHGAFSELGFEQPKLLFFFLASLFLFITLYFGQKRWFVLSLLTSIVFVWPSCYSFFIADIYYPFMMGGYAPLLGAFIYLFGILFDLCILIYWWWDEKQTSPEATELTPVEWRTLGLSIYLFIISSFSYPHSISFALRDFFPFLIPLTVLIDHSIIFLFIIFVGQLMSGLWLISNYNKIFTFSEKAMFRYLVKIGLLLFTLVFIISNLDKYEEIELYFIYALSAFLFTLIFLLLEIIIWIVGINIPSSIKTAFQYSDRGIRSFYNLLRPKIKKLLTIPEIRFSSILFLGYVLGAFLIHNELLNPLLEFWRATEIDYNIVNILVSLIWVFIAHIIALNNVSSEKIAYVTRNNFILFLFAQQLNFWERYYVSWAPFEELIFENVVNYFQSVLLWRITELLVIITFFYLFAFVQRKNLSLKTING